VRHTIALSLRFGKRYAAMVLGELDVSREEFLGLRAGVGTGLAIQMSSA
jgi:hypothetical protein